MKSEKEARCASFSPDIEKRSISSASGTSASDSSTTSASSSASVAVIGFGTATRPGALPLRP